jgi:hypothetical protein
MKLGYKYAIEVLLDHYRSLKRDKTDPEQIQQIKEGIEYLCYPWREDLTEEVRSPLIEDDEDGPLDDDEELARRGKIQVEMSEYVWNVLKAIGAV